MLRSSVPSSPEWFCWVPCCGLCQLPSGPALTCHSTCWELWSQCCGARPGRNVKGGPAGLSALGQGLAELGSHLSSSSCLLPGEMAAGRPLSGSHTCRGLDLGIPAPRTVGKAFLFFRNDPVRGPCGPRSQQLRLRCAVPRSARPTASQPAHLGKPTSTPGPHPLCPSTGRSVP